MSQQQLDNELPQFLAKADAAVKAGRIEEAIYVLKQGMLQSRFQVCNENGMSLEKWIREVVQSVPEQMKMFLYVGRILIEEGRQPQFIAELGKMMKLQRDMANIHFLSEVMLQMGGRKEVVGLLQELVKKNPSRIDAMFVLATVLKKTGKVDIAEELFKDILKQGPCAPAYNELAIIYMYTGRLSESIQCLKEAIEAYPGKEAELSVNIVNVLMQTGKTQEAIELLRKAVKDVPTNVLAHSNLLLHLHHQADIDPHKFFDEHKKWGQNHAPPELARVSHKNIPDPDRRLRIGYISPDYRRHSVAYFFEPILGQRDRGAVEVYGYGNVNIPDRVTRRLKQKFDYYRDIRGVSDEEVARMIEHDQIDILVDLSGHTADNRLLVLAYKPAPVQVTYLGYPNTTGMQQVDYRFTDSVVDPDGSQKFYVEDLVYLPEGFLCYYPSDNASLVAPLPAIENGFITFGSFNNNRKISDTILSLWAQILKATHNSRLLLKFRGGKDQEVKNYYLRQLERLKIPRETVEIHGLKNPTEHLRLYDQVDIALDTYPYNGTTTTCEALWMGVPVVSLFGRHHASRVGLSILSSVGLEFFAASTPEQYIAKATALASKPHALAKIRDSMRGRMAASTLCDARKFAQHVETAYRKMWLRWCQGQNDKVHSEKFIHQQI
ncbi:MAG: tetratricopeptide repeat protein [Planctomycetes bacterium]|nr:tetratricopeptide repeat protein [Planctomycetota bacterium]